MTNFAKNFKERRRLAFMSTHSFTHRRKGGALSFRDKP